MTDKELRKLHREDLLQILISQQRQIDELTAALEDSEAALNDRKIALEEAGSIAEAALRINGVFASAQAAADQYIEELRLRAADATAEAERKAANILAQAHAEADRILSQARREAGLPEADAAQSPETAQPQESDKRRGGLFRRRG